MSDETPKQILCVCRVCGQQALVDYTPNEFISEQFVMNSFICRRHSKAQKVKSHVKSEATLPYKDQ